MADTHSTPKVNPFRLCSYNSHGHGVGRIEFINELFKTNDIVCIQEHWLFSDEISSLERSVPGSMVYGSSGMTEDRLVAGRPYGGCAIVVKKNLRAKITPLTMISNRVFGIQLEMNGQTFLVFSVYMPCDTSYDTANADDYVRILREIASTHELLGPNGGTIIAGDFNTDMVRLNSLHTVSLQHFLNDYHFHLMLLHPFSTIDYTYESKVNAERSTIDHIIVSEKLSHFVTRYNVVHSGSNLSDHSPVCLVMDIPVVYCQSQNTVRRRLCWNNASEHDIELYRSKLNALLLRVVIPPDLCNCRSPNCQSHSEQVIQGLCKRVCEDCLKASDHLLRSGSKQRLAGWNELVAEHKERALFWHRLWKENNSPKDGIIFDIRKSTRRNYHKILSMVKKDQEQLQNEKMAEALNHNRSRNFWAEIKKVRHSRNRRQVNVVDDCSDEADICSIFGEKLNKLYNSVPYDKQEMARFMETNDTVLRTRCTSNVCYHTHVISSEDVEHAVKKLKPDKNDGNIGMFTNHLKNGTSLLFKILADLFTIMFIHNVIPHDFILSTLLPIPKNIRALCQSDNYRPIALSSVLGKVLDHIFLKTNANVLCSSELQFGFKKCHSTVTCSFVVQETIAYYNSRETDVYNVLLDASKAFDRVHFMKLFKLLAKRDVCPVLIRFLVKMYTNQKIRVRWLNHVSQEYTICNGVKQGGVLSPILFAIFMDELLIQLQNCNAGCRIGGVFVGAQAYADDVCLLAPSATGMRRMLKVCEAFARQYHVTFNAGKSALIVHPSRRHPCTPVHLDLLSEEIPIVPASKHLGISIGHQGMEQTAQKAIALLYSRTNVLFSQFQHVYWRIRYNLFRTFCLHLYGCEVWDITHSACVSFCTAVRKCSRKVLGLPYRTHCRYLPYLAEDYPVELKICLRIIGFLWSAGQSNNSIIKLCHALVSNGSSSSIGRTVSKLAEITRFSREQLLVGTNPGKSHIKSKLFEHFIEDVPNDLISVISELLDVSHGDFDINLDANEISFLIDDLCTS